MSTPTLPALLERFFTVRLMQQQNVSPNTVASYRDTFRLLLVFAQKHLGKAPSSLNLEDIDAMLVGAFLEDLEANRSISARTRNLWLTAIRSFFRFVSYEEPAHGTQIQQVLAVPSKRQDGRMVHFLTRPEIEALLVAPDQSTWIGRRDHILLLLAVQTGLRLSELIGLDHSSVVLGSGAHVPCMGKGRKERCTPITLFNVNYLVRSGHPNCRRTITRTVSTAVQAWLKEPARYDSKVLFSTRQGRRLSADTVQYIVAEYAAVAQQHCPSLKHKRITPHVLRHYVPFLTMSGNVKILADMLGDCRLSHSKPVLILDIVFPARDR